MKRVEFRLSMPGVASWNGRWSGEDRDYLIYKNLPDKKCDEIEIADGASWGYSWSDGWRASVSARIMNKGERKKKSCGFSGYDWMVRSILDKGHIVAE